MCGIVGITSSKDFSVRDTLLASLKRLEYRGYDSAGFATSDGVCQKQVGEIDRLISMVSPELRARTAIAHTRWATHGGISVQNAHPHSSGGIFLVHNGIIENYLELRQRLQQLGCSFSSETDSEVIAHYLQNAISRKPVIEAIRDFLREAQGTYAVVFSIGGQDRLYAFKKDSPLCLGIIENGMVLASDPFAFSHLTKRVVFFDDLELAEVSPQSYSIHNLSGRIEKPIVHVDWEPQPVLKHHFEHFMLKEIYDQPEASARLIASLRGTQQPAIKKLAELVRGSKRVLFLACGTSYHASLIGAYLLSRLGFEAHAVIASEFEGFSVIDNKTLVIAVSQSGETMDVISVLKHISQFKPSLAAIVNMPHSTIHRMAGVRIEIMAGQEMCVAATKSFTNTLITLYELARVLGNHICLDDIPSMISFLIKHNEPRVQKLSKKLQEKRDIFVLGHRISYPLAREIALKLKEISYIHAEGMMAGELKHGTIALVEPGVPVIGLLHYSNRERMESALKEVEARGAVVYPFSPPLLEFPKALNEEEYSIAVGIIGHLLSYHTAKLKGLPIDKPRNLAKSVTVK